MTSRLLDVVQALTDNPSCLDMRTICRNQGTRLQWHPEGGWPDFYSQLRAVDLNTEGSTACVAGLALIMWPDEIDPSSEWDDNARRILGLSRKQATELFYDVELTVEEVLEALREMT
jgi:hypothetical protein